MKPITKTGFAALVLLLAMSCTKENTTIQSSGTNNESSMQAQLADIDGYAGKIASVTIGTQVWMRRNMATTHYRNGDRIPQVKDPAAWAGLTTGAWCWYNNDSTNGCIYGKLYNWYAAHDPRGLAPAGWHIPSDSEWTTLTTFLGGETLAGGKMKSTGTIEDGTGLWYYPNTDATNSSGFTGHPGGNRYFKNGGFGYIGSMGYWWSSTEASLRFASANLLFYYEAFVIREYEQKTWGFSVRCLRD